MPFFKLKKICKCRTKMLTSQLVMPVEHVNNIIGFNRVQTAEKEPDTWLVMATTDGLQMKR